MKAETLFRAYTESEDRQEQAIISRGSSLGIAIDDDDLAKMWRRYGRLATKIRHRFYGWGFCGSCGWLAKCGEGRHYSWCSLSKLEKNRLGDAGTVSANRHTRKPKGKGTMNTTGGKRKDKVAEHSMMELVIYCTKDEYRAIVGTLGSRERALALLEFVPGVWPTLEETGVDY